MLPRPPHIVSSLAVACGLVQPACWKELKVADYAKGETVAGWTKAYFPIEGGWGAARRGRAGGSARPLCCCCCCRRAIPA
jgi:hypothetical protein